MRGFRNEDPSENSGHDPKSRGVLQETLKKPRDFGAFPKRKLGMAEDFLCSTGLLWVSTLSLPQDDAPPHPQELCNQNQGCTGPGDDEFPI